jgi:hypothetical protein
VRQPAEGSDGRLEHVGAAGREDERLQCQVIGMAAGKREALRPRSLREDRIVTVAALGMVGFVEPMRSHELELALERRLVTEE